MAKLLKTQLFPSTSSLDPKDIEDPKTKAHLIKIRRWAKKITQFLDGTFRTVASIPFNQSEFLTVADSGNADTEFSVTHYLKRTPAGFIVTKSDKACSVYDSGTTWTTGTIYLKCDAANTALTITVF